MGVATEQLQTIDLRVERLTHTILKLSIPSVMESMLTTLVYLFAITLGAGLRGVWLATAVDWSMRALIMFFLYMRGGWKEVVI